MTERPILFSAPMVRAILAGTKTQTRRVVKPRKDRDLGCELAACELAGEVNGGEYRNAYCSPGDRLWVREAWRDWSDAAWHYAADGLVLPKQRDRGLAAMLSSRAPFTWESYRWRPSIHMPRWASRITLEVTGVRVERLQGISEADAMAEGAAPVLVPPDGGSCPHVEGYRDLWESINGTGSWDANPWVWVVEFRRIDAAMGEKP